MIDNISVNPLPFLNTVGRSVIRLNVNRKRCTYYSSCGMRYMQVFDFMELMRDIEPDNYLNIFFDCFRGIFLLPTLLGLFDNASLACEESLQVQRNILSTACIY